MLIAGTAAFVSQLQYERKKSHVFTLLEALVYQSLTKFAPQCSHVVTLCHFGVAPRC
jgi:hypothetical protein